MGKQSMIKSLPSLVAASPGPLRGVNIEALLAQVTVAVDVLRTTDKTVSAESTVLVSA